MTTDERGTVNNPIIDIATDADESADNGKSDMNIITDALLTCYCHTNSTDSQGVEQVHRDRKIRSRYIRLNHRIH